MSIAALVFVGSVAFRCLDGDACQPARSIATGAWLGLLALLVVLEAAALIQLARGGASRRDADEPSAPPRGG